MLNKHAFLTMWKERTCDPMANLSRGNITKKLFYFFHLIKNFLNPKHKEIENLKNVNSL